MFANADKTAVVIGADTMIVAPHIHTRANNANTDPNIAGTAHTSATADIATSGVAVAAPSAGAQTAASILGKPTSAANAREILVSLRGRAHSVVTGVSLFFRCPSPAAAAAAAAALRSRGVPATVVADGAVLQAGQSADAALTIIPVTVDGGWTAVEVSFCEATEVRFGDVSDEAIEAYIALGEPMYVVRSLKNEDMLLCT